LNNNPESSRDEIESHHRNITFHIAIFASGAGSNAEKIIQHFKSSEFQVALIVTNNPRAGVVQIAQKQQIPVLHLYRKKFFEDGYVEEFKDYKIDFIVLAGFLWMIPQQLIDQYRNKIINIHPALLPKYGGKGMYGNYVHEKVILGKELESGITIHYVDEHYDHGDIIFQATCPVFKDDTAETLASRIHQLEHHHYPRIIEELLIRLKGKAASTDTA